MNLNQTKVVNLNGDTEYEKLFCSVLNEKFGSWADCETDWQPIPTNSVNEYVEIAREIELEEEGSLEEREYLTEEGLTEWLESGKVISLPFMYIRVKTTLQKCPLCGTSMPNEINALSRRDNKTMICAACGFIEAMEDFHGTRQY